MTSTMDVQDTTTTMTFGPQVPPMNALPYLTSGVYTPVQRPRTLDLSMKQEAITSQTKKPVLQPNQTIMKQDSKRAATGSGTTYQNKKKPRIHMVKPDFDVAYADMLVKLCDTKYLVYGFDGDKNPVIRVQDCAYKRKPAGMAEAVADEKKFVPRLVSLTIQQWGDLLSVKTDIIQAFKNDDDDQNVSVHIGRNTYVTVNRDRGVIDLREFFLPQDPKHCLESHPDDFVNMVIPTRRGVQLSIEGWIHLITTGATLVEQFFGGKIEDIESCTAGHERDDDIFICAHCNPNGYHRWV